MTPSIFFSIYLATHLMLLPVEEVYNANHPKPFPTKDCHIMMNWEEEDFIYWNISKQYELKKYRKSDNKYKAKARKKYWDKKLI